LAPYGMPFYRVNAPENGTVQIVRPMPDGVSSTQLEASKDRVESAVLLRKIITNPLETVPKIVLQAVTFWYLVVDRTQSLFVGISAFGLLVLAALGAWMAYRQRATFRPVLAILIYLNLVYAATLAMARYSMPLYPTLMVFAAAGLVWLVSVGGRWLHWI
jgi:hypothetical protein